jgi:DNA-binding response OmpR family regulator
MKILVVEDEHKIATSLKKGLEQESYTVDVAFDGQTGLDFALGEEYDVMVLDRMLPEMDGLEICQKMRQKGIHTPVLILTAKGQIQDRVEGLDSGADDYLVKPFAFEELLARIRALARRPKDSIGESLSLEDLELNTKTFIVKRGEKHIQLSSKEFALLEYLLRHKNQIVTKEQIISHVWNYDANILPNTVEVYMGYLRNKIDKPFASNLLHTIRGFGYKISNK